MQSVKRFLKRRSVMLSGFYAIVRFLHSSALVAVYAMALVVAVHVVMRYVFRAPLGFGEELAIVLMIVVIFAAMPELFVRGHHLRIDVVADRLPPKFRHWAELFVTTVALLFLIFFTGYATRLTITMYSRDIHYRLMDVVPQWPQYVLAASALALVSVFVFIYLLKLLKRGKVHMTEAQGEE